MFSRRKFGLFITFVLLLITIPFTVWSVKNLRFETRKKASELTSVEEKEFSQIRLLSINKPIYKFTVSGSLTLKKENSFFRIILIDKDQKEYLVYEAYPLIVENKIISLNNACEETCVLEALTPDKLRIDGLATDFEIAQTSYEDKLESLPAKVQSLRIELSQVELKKEKETLKIKKLNEQIKTKGMKWIAGETSVSKLSYSEKKKLFSNPDGTPVDKLPNLQGFEYYKGGIFETKSDFITTTQTDNSSGLPESWDWRNVHGENWNTPVKEQTGMTCWLFSMIGAMESTINTNFNQHLDIDLSEQMILDCQVSYEDPIGMNPYDSTNYPRCWNVTSCFTGNMYCVLASHGLPDQQCDPNIGPVYGVGPARCTLENICENWQERVWKINDFQDYIFGRNPYCYKEIADLPEVEFKRVLIQKGPIRTDIVSWRHAMVLEGYETDPFDRKTIWIFKNSWGVAFGEQGYVKIKANSLPTEISVASLPLGPVIPPTNHSFWPAGFDGQIKCVDKDNDGYCNWGISENKPSTCPAFCKPQKDCDDSNPDLGPFDSNFSCLPVNVTWIPTLTLTPALIPTSASSPTPSPCTPYSCEPNSWTPAQVEQFRTDCWFQTTPECLKYDRNCNQVIDLTDINYINYNCTSSVSPTPTPNPAARRCNYQCSSDYQCQLTNLKYVCVERTNSMTTVCRNTECLDDVSCCPPPTPTPISPEGNPPVCLKVELGNLDCDSKGLINETDLSILLNNFDQANLPSLNTLLQNWQP